MSEDPHRIVVVLTERDLAAIEMALTARIESARRVLDIPPVGAYWAQELVAADEALRALRSARSAGELAS
jgi:hypothetical protein